MPQIDTDYWSEFVLHPDSQGKMFCYIPKLEFRYGLEADAMQTKAPYYISQHSVTKAEFHRFLLATGYDYSRDDLALMDQAAPYADCPATPVSWWDAKNYIRWLRSITNEYYSLPFELEWELAARGTDARLYPWGNEETEAAVGTFSAELPQPHTGQVNAYPMGQSPLGCLDMAGNIWEWCLDSFDPDNEIHVMRGGCFLNDQRSCSCLARQFCDSSAFRYRYAGFRLLYLPGEMFIEYRLAMTQSEVEPAATIV